VVSERSGAYCKSGIVLHNCSVIVRRALARLTDLLDQQAAVVLLGPRQVGKTTLALQVAEGRPAVYLDLESEADRLRLSEPALYLADHPDELVILDEVHRAPGLFQVLRGVIDRARRTGRRKGLFLLLGSASLDLMRQSGESLAGRIALLELGGLDVLEVGAASMDRLWTRGGFPDSFLADDDKASFRWRRDFIRTYLERDIPQLGPRIPAETLRRFWTMLAHRQAGLSNAADLARSIGVDPKTAASYIDLLVDLLILRRLPPWHRNTGKRLVKSPKLYIRDSGLLHALLGLEDKEALLGHGVVGNSWEGFVVETLVAVAPETTSAWFYRTGAGAEIDLVLESPTEGVWAIEIKRSLTPQVDKGFHAACTDLQASRRVVVYPGSERFRVASDIEVVPLAQLTAELAQR
jgi:uncharacterized protein